MSSWTLLLLLFCVSRGNAGECQKPVLEGNVVLTDSAILQNNFPDQSEISLKCAIGHSVDQGSNTITCLNGDWSKLELTCKKKDCGIPKVSANMHYIINGPEDTLFGAHIRPVCDPGYKLRGSSYRQCLVSGWSGKSQCLPVICGSPPEIAHSKIVSKPNKESLEFKDVIQYTCEDKYTLEGNGSVVCQENGSYSSIPTCILWKSVVTCGKLPEIRHSIIVSNPKKENLEFEDVVEFSCEGKYTLVGNRSVVCQENGSYSSLPHCKGECQKPVLEGNVVLTDSAILQNNFPDQSEISLKCAIGYLVDQGSNTITCLNGDWSKLELTCKTVICGSPPEIAHSKIVSKPNKESLEFKDVIQYTCEDKYTLEGNGSVVCQENGSYSSIPTCILWKSGNPRYPMKIVWGVVGLLCILGSVVGCIIYGIIDYYKKRKGGHNRTAPVS